MTYLSLGSRLCFAALVFTTLVAHTSMSAQEADQPQPPLLSPTSSATPALDRDQSDWHTDVTAYLWAVSLDGNAVAAGDPVDVDAPFTDTLSNSDSLIGIMAQIDLGQDDWGVFFSPAFSVIEYDDVPTAAGNVDVKAKLGWFELGAAWRIWDEPLEGSGERELSVEAIAGVRLTTIGLEITDAMGTQKDDQEWIEPFVGARSILPLSDSLMLSLRGDIGGFGAGSDFAWQAIGLLGWDFELFKTESSLFAGYRALGQDYENGNFAWDVISHGPILGLQMRF